MNQSITPESTSSPGGRDRGPAFGRGRRANGHGGTCSSENDELKAAAVDSITTVGARRVAAAVPSATGHHDPGQRREVVDTVFDDPRITSAEHVYVTVPRGDTEALDEVRNRLENEHSWATGATIIVEGRPSADPTRPDRRRRGRSTSRGVRRPRVTQRPLGCATSP